MAAEAGAWCEPARPAARLGPGADALRVCSQVEAIEATIVSIAEGWARSRLRSPGEQTRPDLRGKLKPPTLDLF